MLGLVRSFTLAAFLVAGLVFVIDAPAKAQAPSATIEMQGFKGGYIFGLTAYQGYMYYRGRAYPVDLAGVSVGLTIGGSAADVVGEVYNLQSPYDIEGSYGATNSSYAVAGGSVGVVLRNSRGVEIHLRGAQMGLEFSLDVSGIYITLR